MAKTVTIYDIAKEAGVSPATVSRVLTNSARVSPLKEKKVRELIEKYNFQPNAMAKSLTDMRTHTIGLIVADIRNPYYAELAVACEIAASNRGYHVLLCNVRDDDVLESEILDRFVAQRVDAIIQVGFRMDDLTPNTQFVDHLKHIQVPFISTGKLEGTNVYTFGIDHGAGLELAFQHLRSLGHEKIALLGGSLGIRSTYEKWTRYIYLLGESGIQMRPEYVQEGGYDFTAGYNCMDRLLALKERPTALIAINDHTAVGAIAAIQAAGLSVPDDFSIVSHDNTLLSRITMPHLTSVDYGYERLGEGLIHAALERIENREIPQEELLTPVLKVRESCRKI